MLLLNPMFEEFHEQTDGLTDKQTLMLKLPKSPVLYGPNTQPTLWTYFIHSSSLYESMNTFCFAKTLQKSS